MNFLKLLFKLIQRPNTDQAPFVPTPMPTPTPTPKWYPLEQNISKGYKEYQNRYNLDEVPIATKAPELARLGYEIEQRGGDPYLPAALAIKETGGLNYEPAKRINNPFGLGPHVSYPNLDVSILGGGPDNQKGLRGVLFGKRYRLYFDSGDLLDFFKKYTPTTDERNPSYEKQIRQMNTYLDFFR